MKKMESMDFYVSVTKLVDGATVGSAEIEIEDVESINKANEILQADIKGYEDQGYEIMVDDVIYCERGVANASLKDGKYCIENDNGEWDNMTKEEIVEALKHMLDASYFIYGWTPKSEIEKLLNKINGKVEEDK